MLELPEAVVIADQINRAVSGKVIERATANQSPHKFAWYTGNPAEYNSRLAGKTVGKAHACAGAVEIEVDDRKLLLSTSMRLYQPGEKLPARHQLLLEFTDGSQFCATVQMWGALMCFKEDEKPSFEGYRPENQTPSPLSDAFDRTYFDSLFTENTPKLSTKAFLATEQRIPGLGNGVLQDILWTAELHPRRKMSELSSQECTAMFNAVKSVLRTMADQGGRDTETDLFGNAGGYRTILSKNTVGTPCPVCGSSIRKEAYMGGSIYYCPTCQG